MNEDRRRSLIDLYGIGIIPQAPVFEQSPVDGTAYSRIHPQDMDTLRRYIAEQVHAVLHPAMPGLPDVHHFIRIEATDQDGKKWKGMLYGVEEAS